MGIYSFDTSYTHYLSCPMPPAETTFTTTPEPSTTAEVSTTAPMATEKCRKWCAGASQNWAAKCTWKKCQGCAECETVPTRQKCKPWCARVSQDWSAKCTWKHCKGCAECSAQRERGT